VITIARRVLIIYY